MDNKPLKTGTAINAIVSRLKSDINSRVFRIGMPLPEPRALAARYGVSREAAEEAYRRLLETDSITRVHETCFAGTPGVILAPDFKRGFPLNTYVGEFFSFRQEEPGLAAHLNVYDFFAQQATCEHAHDFCEITYVMKGVGHHIHNGVKYPLNPGDCFMVLPDEKHSYESVQGMDIRVVIFYRDILEPFLFRIEQLPGFRRFFSSGPLLRRKNAFGDKLHLDAGMSEDFLAIAEALRRETTEKKPGWDTAAAALLLRLVVILSRYADEKKAAENTAPGTLPDLPLDAAVAFIEQNLSLPLNVEQIARFAFLSVSRLHHLFNEKLGCTVMDYVTRVRLERAKTLLSSTKNPVSQIAFDCGFSTPSHFSRVFKAHFAVTPKKFRMERATK